MKTIKPNSNELNCRLAPWYDILKCSVIKTNWNKLERRDEFFLHVNWKQNK